MNLDALLECIAPPQQFLLKSVVWKDGEIKAAFGVPPVIFAPHVFGPVVVDMTFQNPTTLSLQLCSPREHFGQIGASSAAQFDQHRAPWLCQDNARTSVTVAVDNTIFAANSGGPVSAEEPLPPQLKSSNRVEDYVVAGNSAAPQPNEIRAHNGKITYTWNAVDNRSAVKVWLLTPFLLRATITLANKQVTFPKDANDPVAIISISYISFASSGIAAICAVALLILTIRRTGTRRELLRLAGLVVALSLMGATAIFVHCPFYVPGAILTPLAGWTILLSVLDTSKSGRLKIFLAGLTISVTALLVFELVLQCTGFARKLRSDLKSDHPHGLLFAVSLINVAAALCLIVVVFIGVRLLINRTAAVISITNEHTNPQLIRYSVSVVTFGILAAFGFTVARNVYPDFMPRTISDSELDRILGTHENIPPTILADCSRAVKVWEFAYDLGGSTAYASSILVAQFLPFVAVAGLVLYWSANFNRSLERMSWTSRRKAFIRLLSPCNRIVAVMAHRKNECSRLPAAERRVRRPNPVKPLNFRTSAMVALLLAIAVPWSETGSAPFIVMAPLWLLQAGVLLVIIRLTVRPYVPSPVPVPGERFTLLRLVRREPGMSEDGSYRHEEASRLLAFGPREGARSNAESAARIAAVLSIAPIVYLLGGTALDITRVTTWGWGFFYATIVVVAEAIRGMITGYIFGYLHFRLRGDTGPAKALHFTAIWAPSAAITAAVASIGHADVVNSTLLHCCEFLLISFILSIIYDLRSVKAAGGTWRDLQRIYSMHNYTQIAAVVVPALLAVIALITQLRAGAGLDAARTIINGLNSVVTAQIPVLGKTP
ncbi:hypothetical protein [Mycobacterium sp. 852002-40037_SCH5390672]|uniref:hypothetical protein n=1 Tax=Mycobacterium sp. 852002-40037_SCH5390672 TaxID=1834089 RepID=UPI0012E83DE8|nr:hypothetical protein [Mycobacterium sp. 852002-40037_SCH5390672]